MTEIQRVVRPDGGAGTWTVSDGQRVLSRAPSRDAALDSAVRQLRLLPHGGRLVVYDAGGQVEAVQAIPPSTAPDRTGATPRRAAQPGDDVAAHARTIRDTAQVIRSDGEHVDKGLHGLDYLLGVLAVLGAPVSASMNPALQEAAGDGWVSFTFATFTFTVGCAAAVVVLRRSGLTGYPLLTAVSACYLAALVVAGFLGTGVLDVTWFSGYGAWNALASFVMAALASYGWLGFLVSVGIGSWLGYRLSAHVSENFLA